MARFNKVVLKLKEGSADFIYESESGVPTLCSFYLFIISEAETRGCKFEDLADGFGKGEGTHNDWSAIRDSSNEAVQAMFERSLNHLFPK